MDCKKDAYATGSQLTEIIQPGNVYKYKTSIDVLKSHITGILIVKETDSVTTRLVLVSELGMKIFEMICHADSTKAVYVFEPLNKPALIDVLERNFGDMFLLSTRGQAFCKCSLNPKEYTFKSRTGKRKWFYTGPFPGGGKLTPTKQEAYYRRKLSSKTTYEHTSGNYGRITCKQYGLVKFYFELNAIAQSND